MAAATAAIASAWIVGVGSHHATSSCVEVVADERGPHGHPIEGGSLGEVVGDECLERCVGAGAFLLELTLDEVRACRPGAGGSVGDADDAVDALAVEDAFAGGDGVAGELDTFPDARRRGGLG